MMTDRRRTYTYAVYLIIGTLFVTPVFGLLFNHFLGFSLTPALLGTIGLVFGVYGFAVLWFGDVERGLLIAVLVFMTISANIPFTLAPEGVFVNLEVFLVDGPLLILALISLPSWKRDHVGMAQILLVLYVIWAFLLVAFAPGPRPDVIFYYGLHVTRFALVFSLVTRGIVEDWLSGRSALGVVVLTVLGHALVASVQVFTGPIQGLTVLGFNPRIATTFLAGPLGVLPAGPYVGGFTGGGPFAIHVILVIPVLAVTALKDQVSRLAAIAAVGWLAFLLHLTAWDAARGAFLLELCFTTLLVGWWITNVLWSRGRRLSASWKQSRVGRFWPYVVGGVLALAAIVQAGTASQVSLHQPAYLPPDLGQATARSLAIPAFDLQNLAIRIYQYVGGMDTFLKYPLTGLGGANYRYVASSYAPKGHGGTMLHNIYIGVLAESGLVGALLFFGAIAYAIRAAWIVAEGSEDPLFLGLLAGIGGVLALQFFQPHYLNAVGFVPVWAVLGITSGYYRRNFVQSTDDIWTQAWTTSRVHAALASAWTVQTVSTLPERIHIVLRSGALAKMISGRFFSIVDPAWESSKFAAILRRLQH